MFYKNASGLFGFGSKGNQGEKLEDRKGGVKHHKRREMVSRKTIRVLNTPWGWV